MSLTKNSVFNTSIYFDSKIEWVEKLNKASDPYIEEQKKKNNKNFKTVYHSENISNDENFQELLKYINKSAFSILESQGFDLKDYFLTPNSFWVQEFATLGGGNHSSHNHWNGHISGFYFLKCSEKTSYPIFYDPRNAKSMNMLPEKDQFIITEASSSIHYPKIFPGCLVFFNSYLQHEFTVDEGIEPFRFIHFNIQAYPKQLINNNLKRI